jgi:hypothetical protein
MMSLAPCMFETPDIKDQNHRDGTIECTLFLIRPNHLIFKKKYLK